VAIKESAAFQKARLIGQVESAMAGVEFIIMHPGVFH
jgi:hypothetical protein